MGTVNYSSSDYITMGLKPYDPEFFEDENGAIDCEEMELCYKDERENVEFILEKYSFYYFHVSVKPGYYDGFSLDIAFDFPCFFNDWEERREAQKEVTALKKCLLELSENGLVACSPGWCTGYCDAAGTRKGIAAAVKLMRQDVADTPTRRKYEAVYA